MSSLSSPSSFSREFPSSFCKIRERSKVSGVTTLTRAQGGEAAEEQGRGGRVAVCRFTVAELGPSHSHTPVFTSCLHFF